MKKFFMGAFVLFDMALIGGSGFVLYTYVRHRLPLQPVPIATLPTHAASLPAATSLSTTTIKAASIPGNVPAVSNGSGIRKILFSYRNSHSSGVSIRADFTGWKAEPMQKSANGTWTYQAQLAPGEYAYCFTADDKTFKDPANKRTKQIGRTLVSAIVVEALPVKPPK